MKYRIAATETPVDIFQGQTEVIAVGIVRKLRNFRVNFKHSGDMIVILRIV